MDFNGKRVTVMGLGLHGGGVGAVRWLVEQGADVTVTDTKSEEELAQSVAALRDLPAVRLVLGEHREEDFENADMVVRNPAARRDSPYLARARTAGVPIEMDSSLFFGHCPSPDIIGVTGSKGKTTCARAIAHLLRGDAHHVVEVGTDGASPLAGLADITPDTTVIFELSSWRLEALAERKLSPPTAVVTSLYREHLNTYASFNEYIETKQAIINFQDSDGIAILNVDDELLSRWGSRAQGRPLWFSLNGLGDADGIYVAGTDIVVLTRGKREKLFAVHDLPFLYEHERRNVLPGILLAHLRGIAARDIVRRMATFERLPHRLEEIGSIDGARYINDSAATMPDATIAALRALRGQTLIHILGGGDKDLVFDDLAVEETRAYLRGIVLLPGSATEKIKAALATAFVERSPVLREARSMKEAVREAKSLARRGDVVLLSPGATSFGLFQHEFDRGDQFRQEINSFTA